MKGPAPFWIAYLLTLVAGATLYLTDRLDLSSFWVAFAVSFVAAYPILEILRLTKSRQKIDPHAPETHQRKQGTPTMGGLIVLVGAVASLAYLPLSKHDSFELHAHRGFALGAWVLLLGFATIGFVDDFIVPRVWKDKRGLGWKQKIVLEIGIACWAASAVFQSTSLPFFVTVFLILFMSNAYNFADGLDGLSGVIWLAIAIGVGGLALGPFPAAGALAIAIAGGMAVFLLYNAPPAKVFMGDVGSLPIGALLGWSVAALLWTRELDAIHVERLPALLVLSGMMVAELVPVPMQVAYYKLTKGKRLFPMTPIHHSFEKFGWPEAQIVGTFGLAQLVMSLAAMQMGGSWQFALCECGPLG